MAKNKKRKLNKLDSRDRSVFTYRIIEGLRLCSSCRNKHVSCTKNNSGSWEVFCDECKLTDERFIKGKKFLESH